METYDCWDWKTSTDFIEKEALPIYIEKISFPSRKLSDLQTEYKDFGGESAVVTVTERLHHSWSNTIHPPDGSHFLKRIQIPDTTYNVTLCCPRGQNILVGPRVQNTWEPLEPLPLRGVDAVYIETLYMDKGVGVPTHIDMTLMALMDPATQKRVADASFRCRIQEGVSYCSQPFDVFYIERTPQHAK